MNGNFKIVGIFQKIGPFSGIVEITKNNEPSCKFNLWDQWCFYTRNSFKIQSDWIFNMKIQITQDDIDTSKCKKTHF